MEMFNLESMLVQTFKKLCIQMILLRLKYLKVCLLY